jgi:two-component system phosphate regulon sensor histidine kinase PhoR
MRQEFTANVSHELKTPLTTISGYSEMIANGLAKPEDIARFAEKIHAESERMQTLVGDIIELNALDSEMIHEHSDAVDMLALVQDCMEQLSPHFSAKRLSVYVTGERFVVQGNQRQLWELVYNLLDNARRYNVNGGMIRVQLHQRTLTIQDTGIGIAKEHQARVFERFYRVDKSHSRATGGTGLGLSIVKHVAELHGATIQLESTEHIGTTISISFPE